jgi:DNA-binding GntR family transcriptional regulator
MATDPGGHPDGLVDKLVETLSEQLTSGEVEAGVWLRQSALAQQFQVSRTPIRQALRQLHAQGLVEIVPNQGAYVRGPSAREIHEAYVVRAELEGVAAELAAELISESQLQRLRQAEGLFERGVRNLARRRRDAGRRRPAAESQELWIRANDLFHEVVQEAACNERLRETIGTLHRSFPRNLTWSVLSDDLRLLEENIEHHRRIRDAIERRNGAEARRTMVEHIKRSGDLIAMRLGGSSMHAAGAEGSMPASRRSE